MATLTKKKCYYRGFDYPHENRPCPGQYRYKEILLKYAVHEKKKNKEKMERKDLVHQAKGDRHDVTELRNNKKRPSRHRGRKLRGGLCLYRIEGTKQENTRECYSERTKCALFN